MHMHNANTHMHGQIHIHIVMYAIYIGRFIHIVMYAQTYIRIKTRNKNIGVGFC